MDVGSFYNVGKLAQKIPQAFATQLLLLLSEACLWRSSFRLLFNHFMHLVVIN